MPLFLHFKIQHLEPRVNIAAKQVHHQVSEMYSLPFCAGCVSIHRCRKQEYFILVLICPTNTCLWNKIAMVIKRVYDIF